MFQREFTRITDRSVILEFLQQNNFGQIISENTLKVTHLPFMISEHPSKSENLLVEGHFAKSNDHWQHIDGKSVLLVFTGPHGYITPSVYVNNNVPTWNYSAIHLNGIVEVISDQKEHQDILHKLVNKYETDYDTWNFDQLDPERLERQYKGTVSIRVDVDQFDAKFKMSQNKSVDDIANIIDHLKDGNCMQKILGEFMRKHVQHN